MKPVGTLRMLKKDVTQAVFLLFVTSILLFSHVAVDCSATHADLPFHALNQQEYLGG